MLETIIVAAITGACSIISAFVASNKTRALLEYRIDQLERKVEKHNNIVERMKVAECEISNIKCDVTAIKEDIK